MFEYNYNKFTINELENQYNKNINRIDYYENEIRIKKKYLTIIIIITFFFSWGFTIAGIYTVFNNNLLGTVLSGIFIFAHIYCYIHINITSEEEEQIAYLKKENEKINLALEIKEDLACS